MAAVFDSASSGKSGAAGSSLTFNHTQGNLGANPLIIVAGHGEEIDTGQTNQRITGITYGGQAMTLVDSDENTASNHSVSVAMYSLTGSDVPGSGTVEVVVTYTASCDSRIAGCMSFKNVVDQEKEASNTVNATTTDPLSVAVTTVTGNALLVSVFGDQNNGAASWDTPENEAWDVQVGSAEDSTSLGGYRTIADPAETTVTANPTNPEAEALVSASFETLLPTTLDDTSGIFNL